MTLFITFGLVGLGAEGRWPTYQIRLLLLSVGIVFGELMHGYQAALAKAKSEIERLRGRE